MDPRVLEEEDPEYDEALDEDYEESADEASDGDGPELEDSGGSGSEDGDKKKRARGKRKADSAGKAPGRVAASGVRPKQRRARTGKPRSAKSADKSRGFRRGGIALSDEDEEDARPAPPPAPAPAEAATEGSAAGEEGSAAGEDAAREALEEGSQSAGDAAASVASESEAPSSGKRPSTASRIDDIWAEMKAEGLAAPSRPAPISALRPPTAAPSAAGPSQAPASSRTALFTPTVRFAVPAADAPNGPREGPSGPRRPMGLEALVAKIQGKRGASTMERSRADWDQFKKKEGIQDELRQYTKNGFIDKQEFLARADVREWENELQARKKPKLAGSMRE